MKNVLTSSPSVKLQITVEKTNGVSSYILVSLKKQGSQTRGLQRVFVRSASLSKVLKIAVHFYTSNGNNIETLDSKNTSNKQK